MEMTARVIQITDCHLFSDSRRDIRGVRTRDTFDRVLAAVESYFAKSDRLIITGDLTHDEQLATYELLKHKLGDWWPKLRVIPGNHDGRGLMRAVFGDRITALGERNVFVDEIANWRLIGLDSHVPGKLHGELGSEQLAWLEDQLAQRPEYSTCLFLHHPPVEVQSAWLDAIGLADAASLQQILRSNSQVRGVLCGHVHQERTVLDGQLAFLMTPSTGVQFRPETPTLEVDDLGPGFRILNLAPKGRFCTHVERVTGRQ